MAMYPSDNSGLLLITFVILVIIWILSYIRKQQSLWRKHGIKMPDTHIFGLGAEWELAVKPWSQVVMERHRKYGNLYGSFQLLRPILYVHDPESIKLVMIKDFQCFTDRLEIRTYHELLNQNLFFSEGQKWKRMRTIASPSFTSRKLRNISKTMNRCIEKLFNYLDKCIDKSENVIQTKKVIAGFTMDVIAWCGFSTETNCNDDRTVDSSFLTNGLGLFRISTLRGIAVLTLPRTILNLLNIRTGNSPECFDYFINLSKEICRQRKSMDAKSANKPNDLLQLMLDAEVDEKEMHNDNFDNLTASMNEEDHAENHSKSETKNTQKLTEAEVIANSIIFLVAGFETTSSTISNSMFELAWHQDIQERLCAELKQALDGKDPNSDDYYDTIMQGIPYLEAFIKEVLRKYPPVLILTRRVTVDEYKLKGIPLPAGTQINIPAYAIHHSEEYYQNPFKFDPERWMPENKDRLVPYTWMPFGLGPRNCIGMRFAYQEVKLCLAGMVRRYRFERSANTPKQLTFAPRSPLLLTSPFELKIFKRD